MASVRFYRPFALILLLWTGAARADNPPSPPVLVVDPGMHTAVITSASADRDGRWAVTGSEDKTVRIWALADGKLERTIRLPAGPGRVGRVYAVAMSPDAALIAAGGWTRWTDADPQEQIYLFDRATGALVKRIEGLPASVDSLAFSPDGGRLAAGLGSRGLRVYARERGWNEVARDEDYGDASYGADFASDGRLATTCLDSKVRLYAAAMVGSVHPAVAVDAPGGDEPLGIKFSPADGKRLAVGHAETPTVDMLDGRTLATLPPPNTKGFEGADLGKVVWSPDGATLVTSGRYQRPGGPVLAWNQAGKGPRRLLFETKNTVQSLLGLPNGDLLAAGGTFLIRLGLDGTRRWAQQGQIADFRGQPGLLKVSADGARVGFGYDPLDANPARFDTTTRTLTLRPSTDPQMAVPRQTGLNVEHWQDVRSPKLDGKALGLNTYERSHSLAIYLRQKLRARSGLGFGSVR